MIRVAIISELSWQRSDAIAYFTCSSISRHWELFFQNHLCIIRIKEDQGQNLEEPHTGLPPYQINDYQSQMSACGLINMIGTRN